MIRRGGMDIHKPKPWHSFREFLKEYLIIVVGVLTALAAEAGVEEYSWHVKVENARAAIRSELRLVLVVARERGTLAPCVDRRLDTLSDLLAKASVTRRLPPLGGVSSPGFPIWTSAAWDTFNGSQAVSHMPATERVALSTTYDRIRSMQAGVAAEREAWRTLAMMVGPGRTLDPGTETALYKALTDARSVNRAAPGIEASLRRNLQLKGLPADYLAKAEPSAAVLAPARTICGDIGSAIPPRYGQEWGYGVSGQVRVVRDAEGKPTPGGKP